MLRAWVVCVVAAVGVAVAAGSLAARQPSGGGDLAGVVESPAGPEAGVWVIAETDDLDTRFRKIVVTGDDGRFLVPGLPARSYRVWVRGYGLADSDPVTTEPGQTLTLSVAQAASAREAAQVYPANYWYSLLEPPPASEFPGTGPDGNGVSANLRSQAAWVDVTKQGCQLCHPARAPIHSSRCSRTPGTGSCCAGPIRSVSSRAASTAGSTTPTVGGRAVVCGPTSGRTSTGTSREAKACGARLSVSSSDPTRWRTDRETPDSSVVAHGFSRATGNPTGLS